MGGGDAFDDMVALAADLGISDIVEFTGRVPDEFVQRCLSTADVCLSPDPKNPLNDVSTMNKVVEYMAMARPLVSFDLVEARVSAADAAVYAPANDEAAFAAAIDDLLDDPDRRKDMGVYGRERVERELSWDISRNNLLEFYEDVFATSVNGRKKVRSVAVTARRSRLQPAVRQAEKRTSAKSPPPLVPTPITSVPCPRHES